MLDKGLYLIRGVKKCASAHGRTVYSLRRFETASFVTSSSRVKHYVTLLHSDVQHPNHRFPQVRLLLEVTRGYQKKDLSLFAKRATKDFRRVTYPQSLGKPDQTAEEWSRTMEENMDLWTGDSEVSDSPLYLCPL
jgi:hypothetical protein